MTPDQTKIQELEARIASLENLLSYPPKIDVQAALGIPVLIGTSVSNLTQTYTDSRGDTLTGPKAYAKTLSINISGVIYTVPSL